MPAQLYWLDDVWPGRLAMSARPRGGDWLDDEIRDWKNSGIDIVLSLLTHEEESELELLAEAQSARKSGLEFWSLPIPDRDIPPSESKLSDAVERVSTALAGGRNVLVHCRQGVGRTGLVAACFLVKKGMSPGEALQKLSGIRGAVVPETEQQRRWVDRYSPAIASKAQ